jgi:hypothetical protein
LHISYRVYIKNTLENSGGCGNFIQERFTRSHHVKHVHGQSKNKNNELQGFHKIEDHCKQLPRLVTPFIELLPLSSTLTSLIMVHRQYSDHRRYSDQDEIRPLAEVESSIGMLRSKRPSSTGNIQNTTMGKLERVSGTRKVLFGEVRVMEFPMEIGDNPSVRGGCPLTIGWHMQSMSNFDLDSYEEMRPPNERRQRRSLRLTSERRTQILLNHGHTPTEIASKTLEALKVKDSREIRKKNQKYDRLYEALVMTGHKVKKVASKTLLSPGLLSPSGRAQRRFSTSRHGSGPIPMLEIEALAA